MVEVWANTSREGYSEKELEKAWSHLAKTSFKHYQASLYLKPQRRRKRGRPWNTWRSSLEVKITNSSSSDPDGLRRYIAFVCLPIFIQIWIIRDELKMLACPNSSRRIIPFSMQYTEIQSIIAATLKVLFALKTCHWRLHRALSKRFKMAGSTQNAPLLFS